PALPLGRAVSRTRGLRDSADSPDRCGPSGFRFVQHRTAVQRLPKLGILPRAPVSEALCRLRERQLIAVDEQGIQLRQPHFHMHAVLVAEVPLRHLGGLIALFAPLVRVEPLTGHEVTSRTVGKDSIQARSSAMSMITGSPPAPPARRQRPGSAPTGGPPPG